MGRWSTSTAPKCEHACAIDLAYLRRRGLLTRAWPKMLSWSRYGEKAGSVAILGRENGLLLAYRVRRGQEAGQDIKELVPYVWTPTRFGGRRQWFKCLSCGKGCRILYGGVRFRCRRCHGLRYTSQYEPPGLGGVDRADKIRRRLGDKVGSAFERDEFPPKPKGMHWKTYERLERRYDELQFRWTVAAMARFGIGL